MIRKARPRPEIGVVTHLNVDVDLPTPLYHQIYVILLDKIASGVYSQGSRVPSEHEIEELFGVSRITARKALDHLAAEGLVVRQRGRGTIVTAKPAVPSLTGNAEGLIENLLAMAMETDVEVLGFAYVHAKPLVADALAIQPFDIVQQAVRIRRKKDLAFSYAITHIPEDIGRKYSERDIGQHPILTLIESTGHQISHASQSLTATLADNIIGPALGAKVGSALLKVTRIVYDTDDRPVEHIVVHYRPDLYQLNLNLSRVVGATANKWAIAE